MAETRLRNLKGIRKESGKTQEEVARDLDIPISSYRGYEQLTTNPELPRVELIADYFNCAVDDLLGKPRNVIDVCVGDMVNVPLLGSIAAGEPIEMDAADNVFPISSSIYLEHPHSFLLHVEGESMNKRIPNGSLVLIDRDEREPIEGSPFAVCVNGYDATIKKLRRLSNGIELVPDSWDVTYKPKQYDFGNPNDEEITIIGRVVWMTAPFDYEI